ncbi:MAG: nitronate monooxygenase [Chitinophagales bacterium]
MINQFLIDTNVSTPVVCGPMYPGSNPELVAAVSEAGGLGVVQPITMTYVYKHDFRKGIQLIKSLTDKPFGVNFTLLAGNKRYEKRLHQWMDIAIEEGTKFFLTSLGNPRWVVDRAHQNGIVVYHDITTRKYAQKAIDAGVDGLNCVNNRAGGQTGLASPEDMMNELHDLKLPLVCAGGVGNETDFIKVLEMGYAAVQMGTRFLATNECIVPESYKEAIIKANESDIVWTNKLAGTISSVIRTPDIEKGGLMVNPIFSFLLKQPSTKKLMRTILLLRSMEQHKKVVNRPGYDQIWQAGKGVGNIVEKVPAGDVVKAFHEAYQSIA